MAEGGTQASLLPILDVMGPQVFGTKQATLAFYTLLVYDYFLTLPTEIEHIWKKRFSLVTFLFLINRYYGLLVFTIGTVANLSPIFSPEHFSLFFPFAIGIVMTFTPDVILALRVYALYEKSRAIGAILVTYLLAELSVALWIYCTPGGGPLPIPAPVAENIVFHLCIEETAASLGNLKAAAFQFMQTIYDTGVFSLICYKALNSALKGSKSGGSILNIIAKHGVTYYAALFSANLTWALMIFLAPEGLKYSAASPTLVLATTMVSRITLSLRLHTSKMDPHFNTEIGLDSWKVPTNGSSGYLTSALPTMTVTDTTERTYGTAHTESVLEYYSEYNASNSHSYELSSHSTGKDHYYDHSFYK